MFNSAFRATVLAAALAVAVSAGALPDPTMGVDVGSLSDPIHTGANLVPVNGGGVFGFYNPLPVFITSLEFGVTLQTSLTPSVVESLFTCNDANNKLLPDPFFNNCSVYFDPTDNRLTISFFGVNSPDEESPADDDAGEQEGIPPLQPGCLANPDLVTFSLDCTTVGHFLLILNNNFSLGPNSGGWSVAASPELFTSAPVITVDGINTPEPASALLLLAGLSALARLARRRARVSAPRP